MGKKVIRLTEADIENIVNKILSEQENSRILPCPSGGVFKIEGSSLLWANNENDSFDKIWEKGAKPTFILNKNSQLTPTGFIGLQETIFSNVNKDAFRGANILPMQNRWENQVVNPAIFFYSIDDEGNIHGDVSTVIPVNRQTVRNLSALGNVMGSDGDLPKESDDSTIIFGDTYVKLGKTYFIAVRSLGPKLRFVAPAPTRKPVTDRIEMALMDMFKFDTIDFVDEPGANQQIMNFVNKLKQFDTKYPDIFRQHVQKSKPMVYGYASIDDDPNAAITGKFSPCKGQPTRSEYNRCLSQYRADKVAKLLNDYLESVGMNVFSAKGVGETDKFAKGMKWPEVKDNTKTAPNRRVYTNIPEFVYSR